MSPNLTVSPLSLYCIIALRSMDSCVLREVSRKAGEIFHSEMHSRERAFSEVNRTNHFNFVSSLNVPCRI